jgi:hypothetical protein
VITKRSRKRAVRDRKVREPEARQMLRARRDNAPYSSLDLLISTPSGVLKYISAQSARPALVTFSRPQYVGLPTKWYVRTTSGTTSDSVNGLELTGSARR